MILVPFTLSSGMKELYSYLAPPGMDSLGDTFKARDASLMTHIQLKRGYPP